MILKFIAILVAGFVLAVCTARRQEIKENVYRAKGQDNYHIIRID